MVVFGLAHGFAQLFNLFTVTTGPLGLPGAGVTSVGGTRRTGGHTRYWRSQLVEETEEASLHGHRVEWVEAGGVIGFGFLRRATASRYCREVKWTSGFRRRTSRLFMLADLAAVEVISSTLPTIGDLSVAILLGVLKRLLRQHELGGLQLGQLGRVQLGVESQQLGGQEEGGVLQDVRHGVAGVGQQLLGALHLQRLGVVTVHSWGRTWRTGTTITVKCGHGHTCNINNHQSRNQIFLSNIFETL